MAITDSDIYNSLPQLISNTEQISWNRLYNFLTANSIMILAWSAVYAAELPPSYLTTGVLVVICTTGGNTRSQEKSSRRILSATEKIKNFLEF